MRNVILSLGLGAALLSTGCSGIQRSRPATDGRRAADVAPTAPAMIGYLNDNARRIQGLTCADLEMECRQGREAGVVGGRLDCARPRNFRLTGRVASQPMVDIGSNEQEFWYWISKAQPPYVYHCGYEDFARGGVAMPFPFQPDMILAALGMLEYDPNKNYEVKNNGRTVELIETTASPAGQPIKKVTVFARGPVGRDQPVVVGHALRDAQGRDICTASISHVQTDPTTGAVVPRRVRLVWPTEQIELKMKLDGVRVAPIDQEMAARVFSRANLSNLTSYDLARRAVDSPGTGASGQLQRVGVPPR